MPDRYARPEREMYGHPLDFTTEAGSYVAARVVKDPEQQAALDEWAELQAEFETAWREAVTEPFHRQVVWLVLFFSLPTILLMVGLWLVSR